MHNVTVSDNLLVATAQGLGRVGDAVGGPPSVDDYLEASTRIEALRLAHNHEKPEQVIERAEAYLKFLQG